MGERPASRHYDTLQEALAGIASSPERSRSPFMPIRRGTTTSTAPSSPLASKHPSTFTPTAGPLAPLTHNNLSRLPPADDHHELEHSPSLRAKKSTPALASSQAPIQVRARVTPAANVRRKVNLPGAERADPPPVSRTRAKSVSAPKALIVNHATVPNTMAEGSVVEVWNEPEEQIYTGGAGKESVLVCLRIRPAVATGHSALSVAQQRALAHQTHDEAWIADEKYATVAPLAGGTDYRFDSVVTGSGNQVVYAKAARNLVLSSMEGFDACVFAYGQTASGKTFTLTGTASNPGIIPQAVKDVFAYIRSHPSKDFLLRASFIEIYNEQIKDLLAPENDGQIKIRQDAEKRFFVSPLHEEIVTCEAQVAELLKRGDVNRHTAGTDFNARSSRSHTVFQMVIESRDAPSTPTSSRPPSRGYGLKKGAAMLDDGTGGSIKMSRLSLVDLAGSERATSQSERRVEGGFINKSLLTLEKVIAALTEDRPRAHIPYRDSKLTQILQPSLSGEARVAVICTVNPSVTAVEESKSTLKFATRVKKVTLHAEKREIVDDKALITKYRSTIAELQAQLAAKDAELSSTVPPTPRTYNDEAARAAREARDAQALREQQAIKQQIAHFQLLFVNSANVDVKRDDLPRAVSPTKPTINESADNLHDQLMDARYALEEKTEEVIRLKDQLKEITLDRDSRPVVSPDATASIKDEALAQLDQERRELQCILADSDANYDAAIRRAKQTARKELQLRCESLEGQLEAQKALHADALAQVDAERRRTQQLEQYILQHLQRSAERLTRPRVSSISESPLRPRRSVSLGGDSEALPQLADEEPDLEVVSTQFANLHVDIDGMGRSDTMMFDYDRGDREKMSRTRMRQDSEKRDTEVLAFAEELGLYKGKLEVLRAGAQ